MFERRREVRVPGMSPVVIHLGDSELRAGVTEDLSVSGVRLRTTAAIPVGTPVCVRFEPDDGTWTESYGVVVRHCEPAARSLFAHAHGVRFSVCEEVVMSEL